LPSILLWAKVRNKDEKWKKRRDHFFHFTIIIASLLGVGAHPVEDGGYEGLETRFAVLADGGLWDVWVLLN